MPLVVKYLFICASVLSHSGLRENQFGTKGLRENQFGLKIAKKF